MRKNSDQLNFKMRLKLVLTAAICFGFMSYTCSQSLSVADSLFKALDQNPRDSIAFIKLNEIIRDSYYSKPGLAMDISKKKLHYVKESGNQLEIGRTMLHIGIIHDLNANYDSALSNYVGALQVAEENNFNKLKADVYNNLSICLSIIGNMEESVSYSLKALEIYEILKHTKGIAAVYNGLGSRYMEMNQYEKSLEYYEKAAQLNLKLGRTSKLYGNYGNIGLLYLKLKQSENALNYLQKSLALIDTVNDLYDYSINIQYHVQAYQQIKDYEKALVYQERAYEIAIQLNDEVGIFTCMKGFGKIYTQLGEYNTALEYFKKSEKLAERLGSKVFLTYLYNEISLTYARLNNYQKAYDYNRKYSALNDTILTKEKVNAIQRIKQFDVDKKQKEITVLTQDSEIQSLKAKRQLFLRNFILAIGIFLLLITLLLHSRYRYIKRTRNDLSEKNRIIALEKNRSDELLFNILPEEVAEELKAKGTAEAKLFELVTVIFSDFKGFTSMSEKLTPKQLVANIHECFSAFDAIIEKHGIEKIKTIGDAYMCAGGVPVPDENDIKNTVLAGLEMQSFMKARKIECDAQGLPSFEMRVGVHTGPVVAGIVGVKKFQYDIWGDTVNTASRMESSGAVGKVNISQSTYELLKDDAQFSFESRGKIDAKGKGEIEMYFVSKT